MVGTAELELGKVRSDTSRIIIRVPVTIELPPASANNV